MVRDALAWELQEAAEFPTLRVRELQLRLEVVGGRLLGGCSLMPGRQLGPEQEPLMVVELRHGVKLRMVVELRLGAGRMMAAALHMVVAMEVGLPMGDARSMGADLEGVPGAPRHEPLTLAILATQVPPLATTTLVVVRKHQTGTLHRPLHPDFLARAPQLILHTAIMHQHHTTLQHLVRRTTQPRLRIIPLLHQALMRLQRPVLWMDPRQGPMVTIELPALRRMHRPLEAIRKHRGLLQRTLPLGMVAMMIRDMSRSDMQEMV